MSLLSSVLMGQHEHSRCAGGLGPLMDRFSLLQVHKDNSSGLVHHCCAIQRPEDQDSGTESDKDSCHIWGATHHSHQHPYGATSPDEGTSRMCDFLQTHQQLLTSASHPIYSRDTYPLPHSNHSPMATMLAWQHLNMDSKFLTKQSKCSDYCEPYIENNNNKPLFAQTMPVGTRQDSEDSCICDCDGYNSEDELTSINFVEVNDDDDDEDEDVELEQILQGCDAKQAQMTSCGQRMSSGRNNGLCSWGTDSADEGFQEDMIVSTPQPLRFSSSPPREGLACYPATLSPQEFLVRALPQWPAHQPPH